MAAPYLTWPRNAALFLVLRAIGYTDTEAMGKLQNPRTPDVQGLQLKTLVSWRARYPSFVIAERETIADPLWCHKNIATPMKLAASDWQDLKYLFETGDKFKGFPALKQQLILQEMGLLNVEKSTDRFEQFLADYKSYQEKNALLEAERLTRALPAPDPTHHITVLDVTPVMETQRDDSNR
jgi:hypothetical protein